MAGVAGVLLILLALLLLLGPAIAHAETTGFDARPMPGSQDADLGYFRIDVDRGAEEQRVVVVTNHTEAAKSIRLAACDGRAASYGGVAYSDSGEKPQAVGAWIQLSRTSVEVPPQSSVEVPFTVKVPADATTGAHVGGVAVWEPAAATVSGSGDGADDEATTKITMVTRMVLTVFVTTPGPAVPALKISGVTTDARSDGMYLLVAIANAGTAPTTGEGVIKLTGDAFEDKIALGDMIPQAKTGYPILWKVDPAEGSYPAEVQIRYAGGTKVATWSGNVTVAQADAEDLADTLVGPKTASEAATPWLMYGLIGGLVVVVLIMGFALLRRRRA